MLPALLCRSVSAQSILPNGGFEQAFIDYGWPVYPFWDFTNDYSATPQTTINNDASLAEEGSHYLTLDYTDTNTTQGQKGIVEEAHQTEQLLAGRVRMVRPATRRWAQRSAIGACHP